MMNVCFFVLGLLPPRELSFGNEGYSNVTSGAKIPIFSVADDDLPFRQCCMKPYIKKNMNDEERDVSLKMCLKYGLIDSGYLQIGLL